MFFHIRIRRLDCLQSIRLGECFHLMVDIGTLREPANQEHKLCECYREFLSCDMNTVAIRLTLIRTFLLFRTCCCCSLRSSYVRRMEYSNILIMSSLLLLTCVSKWSFEEKVLRQLTVEWQSLHRRYLELHHLRWCWEEREVADNLSLFLRSHP